MVKIQEKLDVEVLRKSFLDIFFGRGIEISNSEVLFSELIYMYQGVGRHYHNLKHIERMLLFLEKRKDRIEDWVSIQLAVWFHDCIYDIHEGKNEERSADFARERLADIGLSSEIVEKVANLILLTKNHNTTPEYSNFDTKIFLDSDLMSLGGSFEEYKEILERIRKEYCDIPEEVFKKGRREFLTRFLSRSRIFHTDEMFVEFEEDSRRNMRRELDNI